MSKFRLDFITNSSSSSFVVSYKALPKMETEVLEKYPYIKNYIKLLEKALIGDSNVVRNMDELNKYFCEEYGWRGAETLEQILEENSYNKEQYEKYKERIINGYNITFKSIDYNDESTSDRLWSLNDGVNFIVEGEG